MRLAKAWEEQSTNWTAWARADGHDSYWRFHRRQLLGLLPPPGRRTLDLGCGEGRVARDLAVLGHDVIGIDLSAGMITAAGSHPDGGAFINADAAAIPLPDASVDLVLAFMTIHDMDDPASAMAEIDRVLMPGGRLHIAIVHPLNSAGQFVDDGDHLRPFVITDAYLDERHTSVTIERDGYRIVFESAHRTIDQYARWLERYGMAVERLRELSDPSPETPWRRVPLFLHLTAIKQPWRPLDRRLFHIASAAEADELQQMGERRPPSLDGEGFVHLSTAAQVVGSTERHFPAGAELVLVELDPELLVDDVRWPEVYPGQRFPHLHGPLTADAVVAVHPWGPDDRRRWAG
ncbi:MAG: DUF952 domain-containing protein [Actinomycetota bacterium]